MDYVDEKELIERAKKGDHDAFKELVEAYKNQLHGRIYTSLLPDLTKHVEDVYVKTLVKAWKALPKFTPEGPGSFAKWLTIIACHTAIDTYREKSRTTVEFDEKIDSLWNRGLGTLLEEQDVGRWHECVASAMAKLDYDCRILVLASYVYGIPPVEISRFARSFLLSGGKYANTASRVQEWLQKMIGPLEKQATDRRNYCFAKLKEHCDQSSTPISKNGSKRESRGGTTKPNSR